MLFRSLRYKQGIRRNINHDSDANVEYRHKYVSERLQNLNGKCRPIKPEVFLDESYCHLDHHAKKIWAPVKNLINEFGRKPMMVIFAAFVIFREGRRVDAEMIKDSVTVWPVNGGKNVNPDSHDHFTAEKFEQLFERLGKSLLPYGSCIIHMDGASYHKRKLSPTPKQR